MNQITAPTLRRLMEDDESLEEVCVSPIYEGGDPGMDYYNFRPAVADIFPRGSAGWKNAGEIIGNNSSLHKLVIGGAGDGDLLNNLKLFFNGVKRNNTIECLRFIGWEVFPFRIMVPLLQNNCNLTVLSLFECRMRKNGVRLLASALSSCTCHRLERISICNCSIEDGEPFNDLVTALNVNSAEQPCQNPTLSTLDLQGNKIGRNGCAALASLLSNPDSELKVLCLKHNNIEDIGVASLADGLAKNDKLECLDIVQGNSITNQGWAALSRILCNTTTINHTFSSNHNLQSLGRATHEGKNRVAEGS
ncbi:LOW QUALITY PROTEIN: hypothetical protein ACHAXR_001261 [Thalassiosira sp. AJA248-18]